MLRSYKSERSQGNKMFSKEEGRKWNMKEDCRRITKKDGRLMSLLKYNEMVDNGG